MGAILCLLASVSHPVVTYPCKGIRDATSKETVPGSMDWLGLGMHFTDWEPRKKGGERSEVSKQNENIFQIIVIDFYFYGSLV